MAESLLDIPLSDLQLLADNIDKLPLEDRIKLRGVLKQRERGCRINRWINSVNPILHDKQRTFLSLECREAMFGGAAGGGKSQSLILAALQYVDQPGYNAIIFRRTFTDLAGAGSIMDRTRQMLSQTDAKWSSGDKTWIFETEKGKDPARLSFGYLENEDDKFRYQGWEFAAVLFDELTQHPQASYSYLFSRLRRLKGSNIPIRMRSATNPGGKHGDWVKEAFIPDEYLKSDSETQNNRIWTKKTDCGECHATGMIDRTPCVYCDGLGYRERTFVPSRIRDNPSLDEAEYLKSLIELPVVERHRLESGDWQISEQGDLFKTEWFRYYSRNGDHFRLHRPKESGGDLIVEIGSLLFFMTADTASKEKTTADYTCICTWAFHAASGSIILIHCMMDRIEVPKIAPAIINLSQAGRVQFVMIEDAQCGIGVIQELRGPKGDGMAVMSYAPGISDKVARSTTAQVKAAAGQFYFPAGRPGWLDAPFAQLIGFPAANHDDFVDNVTMAAHYVHSRHQQHSGGMPGILKPVGRW